MTGHPFHDVAIIGRLQHRAGARARGRRLDVDHVQGRARRARRRRAGDPRRRRRRRPVRATTSCTRPGSAPVWRSSSWHGHPRGPRRPRRAIADGHGHDGARSSRARRASTPTGRRPRRGPARRTSSSRRSACSPRPSSRSIARRHMHLYGTKPEALATVAAAIRNNGHVNPEAIYHGRGPFTPQDILDSRMVADPFHLLDCAMTSEGGCGARAHARRPRAPTCRRHAGLRARRQQRPLRPVVQEPADVGARRQRPAPISSNGTVGRARGRGRVRARRVSVPTDVDVCEFYDPFSFEIIRQFEAFGFCERGRGRRLRDERHHRARRPVPGHHRRRRHVVQPRRRVVQLLQRVIRGVRAAARRRARRTQVDGAEVAMCSNGGSGALFTDVMLLGVERP